MYICIKVILFRQFWFLLLHVYPSVLISTLVQTKCCVQFLVFVLFMLGKVVSCKNFLDYYYVYKLSSCDLFGTSLGILSF